MFMAFGCYCHADKLVSHFANRQIAKAANSKERQTNKQPHKKTNSYYVFGFRFEFGFGHRTNAALSLRFRPQLCMRVLAFIHERHPVRQLPLPRPLASKWVAAAAAAFGSPPTNWWRPAPLHSTPLRSALIWSDPSKSLLALPAFIISSKFVFSRFMAMSSRRCRCRSTCSGQIGVQFIKMKFSLLLHIL